jgi:outer membrane lipoprotein
LRSDDKETAYFLACHVILDWINGEEIMITKRTLLSMTLIIALSVLWSCASYEVISEDIKSEAERRVSFPTLVKETGKYKGKTVILGGYILETKNVEGESFMTVLQTPLVSGERPGSKTRSGGGFIVSYKGYLEPDVYEKDRRVTVAGKVVGPSSGEVGQCPNPCLELEYRQIYLWPRREVYTSPPTTYEDYGEAFPMDRWP